MTVSKMLPPLQIISELHSLSNDEKVAFNHAVNDIFFKNATTFTDQVGILCYYLRNDKIIVSYNRIGMVFGKSRFVIHRHHLNFLRGKRPDGRPPSLNEIGLQVVKEEIQRLHSKYPLEYPTYEDIQTFIYEKYGKMLLRDTLRNLIYNKLHEFFRPCNAKPVESDRMNVTIQQIEDNLMELRRAIQGVPPHFCVNIDEMGHTEFGDAVQKIVIVPSNYDKSEASYPIERAGKRASCIACISPIGLFCHPQFAIEERSTIDINWFNYISKDTVQIVGTDSGFVNKHSFLLWLNEVFIPELHIQREKHKYFGKMVIITDGLPAHKLALNQIDLEKENIVVHYLEAHSSDQLQPLDLAIFGGTKRFLSNFKTIFGLSPAANQILKIYQALHQMCSQPNCGAAFKSAGIIVQIQFKNGQITEQMGFDVEKCVKVRGYELSYIQDLVQKGFELTPNQLIIYQKSIQTSKQNTIKKRMKIQSYLTRKNEQ